MKYFTREIWAGWQSDSAAVFARTNRQWKRNLARYKESLRTLAPRLGVQNGRFFTKYSMHDGYLLRLSIGDWPSPNLRRKCGVITRTSVEMAVLPCEKNSKLFLLTYQGVEDIYIRTKNNLFSLPESRFGDWGYDELLPEGKNLFRHNILFQTGTEVSIVFRKFSFKRETASTRNLKGHVNS
jgi:hypothetical protein